MAHKHAELMKQYAEDAANHDRPWELWQYKERGYYIWEDYDDDIRPSWSDTTEYRRRPKTIRIGKYDVPEPVRTPLPNGAIYYVPNVFVDYTFCDMYTWYNDRPDVNMLNNGLVHLDKESASIHAKAIISLTKFGE